MLGVRLIQEHLGRHMVVGFIGTAAVNAEALVLPITIAFELLHLHLPSPD
jgi:hypothetical protein